MQEEERQQELTRLARELITEINELAGDTGDQLVALSKSNRWNRRMIWAIAVSFTLDVMLTVLVAFNFLALKDVTAKVDESQKITQSQVLCPLYQQLIAADTPKARELARKNGQDLAARDEAFRTIRRSYEVLNCN